MRIKELNVINALELLLMDKYIGEFATIGGVRQHKDGLNFYEWLHDNGVIDNDELKRIQKEISCRKD